MPITVKEVPSGNETLRKDKDMLAKQAKVNSLKSGYPTKETIGGHDKYTHPKEPPATFGKNQNPNKRFSK